MVINSIVLDLKELTWKEMSMYTKCYPIVVNFLEVVIVRGSQGGQNCWGGCKCQQDFIKLAHVCWGLKGEWDVS